MTRERKEGIQKTTIYLPDEIVEQILLKLPAQSILRFKSVHKQWLSLISHPRFVQSHLKRVLSDNQKIMSFTESGSEFEFDVLDHDGNRLQAHHTFMNPPFSLEIGHRVHLLGSCHGLICLGTYNNFSRTWYGEFNPLLWNPILNDFKHVPFLVATTMNLFGFGYDSYTDDYKFVSYNNMNWEVYSLKSKSMRIVPFDGIVPGCGFFHYNSIYMNGSLYWLHWHHFTQSIEHGFFVFNLRNEKFRFLKFPNNFNSLSTRRFNLSTTVRSGCQLDVFIYDPKDDFFNLVTMEEDSVNGSISWRSKHIQIPHLGKLQCWPKFYLMNGDIVIEIKDAIFSPNYRTYHRISDQQQKRMIENIAINEGAEDWQGEYITYTETLVSPSNLINCSAP